MLETNEASPVPSVVLGLPMVGSGFQLQATPFCVMAQPPLSTMVPPEVAS